MKLRNASIDDVHLELLYVLDEAAGERWPRLVSSLAQSAYRAHHRALLVLIRLCDRLAAARRVAGLLREEDRR